MVGCALNEHKIAAFKQQFPAVEVRRRDVRDRDGLQWLLGTKPDVVIHAAALKRIETCDDDPAEAIKTNIEGTRHVVEEAMRADVPKVLVISSDKATSPETCYGKTKAAAEEIALGQNAYRGARPTRISCVRYGNVLGSTGSVLDRLWRARLSGAAISITDVDATRFWWSAEQAVAFIQGVVAAMQGAEIWIPKLVSAKVVDLARAIAPDSALTVTGMRGPEKLHEAMIAPTEARYAWELPDCYVLLPKLGQWWSGPIPEGAVKVPDGFTYASDGDPQGVQVQLEGVCESR